MKHMISLTYILAITANLSEKPRELCHASIALSYIESHNFSEDVFNVVPHTTSFPLRSISFGRIMIVLVEIRLIEKKGIHTVNVGT